MNAKCQSAVVALIVGMGGCPAAHAVSVGQTDTFEDGTTSNWIINASGSAIPPVGTLPVNMATGGPAGADDNFLQLTSLGGSGAGSRLTVNNLSQWTGDYSAAGINAIAMDLNNSGSSDLYLRLLFSDPVAGPPSNLAFSTQAIFVPAGSGWTSVQFSISPGDLLAGVGSVSTALTNTKELRLYHSQAAIFPSPIQPTESVAAILGVDNIQARQATTVSEPATLALFGLGLAGIGAMRRKKFGA